MTRSPRSLLLGTLLMAAAATAWSQVSPPMGTGIYTCVDAKGRRLTSDRPIVECIDREQRELTGTGTVRRTLPPTPTAQERAQAEERDRKAAEDKQRQADERRAARALLNRYPNRATHDAERFKALQAQQEVVGSGYRRIDELAEQRKELTVETEFYKDPAQWPTRLHRQFDENAQQVAAQRRFIASQEEEKARINARYDEELARLKVLWSQRSAAAPQPPAAPAPR
jgi:ribosomal protein S17E